MLDRTIPFYNTILRCDKYQYKKAELSKGFSIVPYRIGDEHSWAELEYSVGDFESVDDAKDFFVNTYLKNQKSTNNIFFLLNEEKKVAGSCIASRDKREDSLVSSLHWLIVDEKYHGRGFGKALCYTVMNFFSEQGTFPVYIHTQPWSYKAIFLYLSLGFKLQKNDTFSHYKNEYEKAMGVLKQIVTEKQFKLLKEYSAD
jgi:RimJ/RimL family protein N-acetyltransferase